jgi:hypothetical protein
MSRPIYAEVPLGLDTERACRNCGCTDLAACPGGCWWVEDPEQLGDLCSACLPDVEQTDP